MSTDDPNQLLPDIPPMKHTGIQPPSDILADIRRLVRQQEARLDRVQVTIKVIDERTAAVAGYITTMVIAVILAVIIVAIVVVGVVFV